MINVRTKLINSRVKELGEVKFPAYTGLQVHMREFHVGFVRDSDGDEYIQLIKQLTKDLPYNMVVFVTIDEQDVKAGSSQRRGGLHVDGHWEPTRGWRTGGYWGTETSFYLDTGGMIIASTEVGCTAWGGYFDGKPGKDGDCESMRDQLTDKKQVVMKANTAYQTNAWCLHESMVQEHDVRRQLIRITLPTSYKDF